MPTLPNYYTGYDTHTRLSHGGPVVTRTADSVGDFVPTISGIGQLDPYGEEAPLEGKEPSGAGYFIASTLGAALAGGLVGYLASGGKRTGAGVGAALLGGVRGLSDSAIFLKEGKKELALVGSLFSLVGIASAFYIFTELKERPHKKGLLF